MALHQPERREGGIRRVAEGAQGHMHPDHPEDGGCGWRHMSVWMPSGMPGGMPDMSSADFPGVGGTSAPAAEADSGPKIEEIDC